MPSPRESGTLSALRNARDAIERLTAERERLIRSAVREGYSERVIGAAAGLSGVSIHNRKATLTGDCEVDCLERCQGPCGVSHLIDPKEATDA